MAQSLANVLLHVVFSTKNRRPVIRQSLRNDLHAYLGGICRQLNSACLITGGTADHVHTLCTLPRTVTVAQLVTRIKTSSTKWLNRHGCDHGKFTWQSGYGAFSVGSSQLPGVKRYIASQDEHHRKMTFEEEFLALLDRSGIDYDERYLWD